MTLPTAICDLEHDLFWLWMDGDTEAESIRTRLMEAARNLEQSPFRQLTQMQFAEVRIEAEQKIEISRARQ